MSQRTAADVPDLYPRVVDLICMKQVFNVNHHDGLTHTMDAYSTGGAAFLFRCTEPYGGNAHLESPSYDALTCMQCMAYR